MQKTEDVGLLAAALIGYEKQRDVIDAQIADIRRRLGSRAAGPARTAAPAANKHRISPEGRARIAAAQRRRWAAAKKAPALKTRAAGGE
jgi:hypothetical protein